LTSVSKQKFLFQSTVGAIGVVILALGLSACGDGTKPTEVKPAPPVVAAPGAVGASTGVDLRVDFSVSDPNNDPVDSVFATGVWDSIGFEPATAAGRLIWRACKAGSCVAIVYAVAGGDTGSATIVITVTGTADHYVDMIGGAVHFQPESLFINEGETVAWRNVDTVAHNVYGSPGGIMVDIVRPGCESKPMRLSASGGFPTPGQYPYFCTLDSLRRVGPCLVFVSP